MFNTLGQVQNTYKFAAVAVILFIIIAGVFIFSIISTKPQPSPKPEPSIQPGMLIPDKSKVADLSQDIKAIRQKIIDSKIEVKAGDQILFQSETHRIIYVPTPDIFIVQIYQNPQETRHEAQQWFLNFGLKIEDLCALPVRFALGSIELKKENPNFNNFPDNCPSK